MNRTKKSNRPAVSDDGNVLTPVDAKSWLGDLKVIPFEAPPFPSSRPRRRTKGASRRAETTSTPDDQMTRPPSNTNQTPRPRNEPAEKPKMKDLNR